MPPIGATLGQALRQCRRAAGLTQRALAQRVGVDVSYVSKLENDRMPPPAADTLVKLACALSTAPDELLTIAGKVPSAVHRMLGSQPAALRFFRTAADLAITDEDWEHLTQTLIQLRQLHRPTADTPGLPASLRALFWDCDFEGLRWPADRDLIIARILAVGDWRSVTWLREQIEVRELRRWLIERRGRGLDGRRLRFWELILGLPRTQVDAWIQAAEEEGWGRRTQA